VTDDGTVSGPDDPQTPPDIDLPDPNTFAEEHGPFDALPGYDSEQATDLGWKFCLLFAGRPWQTVIFTADSAGEAAAMTQSYTAFVNQVLQANNYPPNICSWSFGACATH
jgi:hypothetical protein